MKTNTTPTGLSRRELWVDARDIQSGEGEEALSPEEYAQALTTREPGGAGALPDSRLQPAHSV